MPRREVTRRGVRWRVVAPDNVPGRRFWDEWERGWEESTLAAIDRFARDSATMIDIGAWIGATSLWGARYGPVLAVEPDRTALHCLRVNLRENDPDQRVQVVEAAVALTRASRPLVPHPVHGFGSSESRLVAGDARGRRVSCVTCADILAKAESVSMVKMDIEGAEVELLPLLGPALAQRGVPLLVALHEPLWGAELARDWLGCFSKIEGAVGGWSHVLCVP